MICHLKETSKIAEAKSPKEEGQRIVWVFDHSSCHAAMPDETLDVSKMKVNPSRAKLSEELICEFDDRRKPALNG